MNIKLSIVEHNGPDEQSNGSTEEESTKGDAVGQEEIDATVPGCSRSDMAGVLQGGLTVGEGVVLTKPKGKCEKATDQKT